MKKDIGSRFNEWITSNTGILLFQQKDFIYSQLRTNGLIDDGYSIELIGGFDNRILILYKTDFSEGYVYSIGKPLIKSIFFSKFFETIRIKDIFYGIITSGCELCVPNLNIALISLAKKDVYTFPRFALGISDISHSLRNEYKSNVALYDMQLFDLDEIISSITKTAAAIVGVSMTFGLFDIMEVTISSLRVALPKAIIIIGGSLASLVFKEILNIFPTVIVSLNEGEKCMTDIVDWYYNKKELNEIHDIAYINDVGELVETSHYPAQVGIHSLSLPELDLLIPTIQKKGVFQLETSRGCYNACSFCPRRYKGYWRELVNDLNSYQKFLDYYTSYLFYYGFNPTDNILYIVDEEFIGEDSDYNRKRSEIICKSQYDKGIKFELSFRMNAIYSSKSSIFEISEKVQNLLAIHDYGLIRALIGVESGVDSVLKRFNKNITSSENEKGIRMLTALGVPARFTYITFDPLMNISELVETYLFQGRKDLVMKPACKNSIIAAIESQTEEPFWHKISDSHPFYYFVPYMLVSLECLIGSQYYANLENQGLLEREIVYSLGKKNANYKDWRIGLMSKFSQLWIDRNFSLDYTLKSLGKIYLSAKSDEIRTVRTLLKENAYRLLGKMIYIVNNNNNLISAQPTEEVDYIKRIAANHKNKFDRASFSDALQELIDYQIKILSLDIKKATTTLRKVLTSEDFDLYYQQLNRWENNITWKLINDK